MYKVIKRLFDILVAMAVLIALMPLIIIVAVLVRAKMGSPIIFKQPRPGKHKKPFNFYKFRSMTNEKDAQGNLLPNEDRLTKFGMFIRRTSLDELPSLFNVLKGDISLVGPRPLLLRYNDVYNEEQDKRHLVKPGVTGLAQVNGRTAISWEEKFAYDVEYVENQSLLLDFKILLKTVAVVFMRKDTTPSEQQQFEIPFDEYIKNKNK